MTKDMTTGRPIGLIAGFALPLLIGNVFQQIYGIVDTIIVGRFLGEQALAGVGSTTMLTMLLLSIAIGLCNGAGLIVAQCFGSGDRKKLADSVTALIWVAAASAVVMTAVGVLFGDHFLRFLSVPDAVFPYASVYLRIVCTFMIANVIYNGSASVLRSVGDAKTPLYALLASSALNIVLDMLFVIVFHLGVAGAAWATVLSQLLSATVTTVILVKRRAEIGLDLMERKPKKHMLVQVVRTGIPSIMQSSLIMLGNLSVQRLINSFGSAVMAAFVAANKIDSVIIQVIVSIGAALSVYTGQNMGKGDIERIRKGMYQTLVMMLAACAMLAVTVYFTRFRLMAMFLDPAVSDRVREIGAQYLMIMGIAYMIAGVMQTYQNVIRGAGDVNTCMVAGFTELAGRIFFAYLLAAKVGVTGIWIATPISWMCGCVIPVGRYYSGRWKSKRLV